MEYPGKCNDMYVIGSRLMKFNFPKHVCRDYSICRCKSVVF